MRAAAGTYEHEYQYDTLADGAAPAGGAGGGGGEQPPDASRQVSSVGGSRQVSVAGRHGGEGEFAAPLLGDGGYVHVEPYVKQLSSVGAQRGGEVPGPAASGPLGLFSQPGGGYAAAASGGYGSTLSSAPMSASSGGRSAPLESTSGGSGGHGHRSDRPSSDPVLRRSEAAARRMFTAKWGSDGRAQSLVSGSVTPPGAGAGTPTLRSGSMTPVHGAVDFAHWQWLQEQKQRQQQTEFQMWQQYQQQQAQQQQFHQWQQ